MGKVDKDIETLVSEGSVMPDGRRADTARAQLEYKNQLKNAGDIYVGTGDYIVNSDGIGNEIYITEGKNIQDALREDINRKSKVILGTGDVYGVGSTALGYAAKASGDYSIALGSNASASGDCSTALGNNASASKDFSTALGREANASETYSTAVGDYATASGEYSTALGILAKANGTGSTALGDYANASNNSSTAIGDHATASGEYSTALGNNASASGSSSVALGYNAKVNGINARNAVQIGEGTNSVENSLKFRNRTVVNGNGEIVGDYPLGFTKRQTSVLDDGWPKNHSDLVDGTVVTGWCYGEGGNANIAFVKTYDSTAQTSDLNLVIDGNIYVEEGLRRVYAEGDKVGSAVNADNATNAINTSFTNTPWKSGLPQDIKLTEFGTYQFIWDRINLGLIYWDGNIAVNGTLGVLYEGTASSVEDGYTFFIRITSGGLVEIYNNLSSGPVRVTTSVALKYRKIS